MEPILLLEGDPLVACDGVAHSLYALESPKSEVSIQESFCLKTYEKTYRILELEEANDYRCNVIKIQEIPYGLQSYGTGSLAWESSIIMSLYFSVHPEKLHGKILELGSGCGLGLLTLNMVDDLDRITSFTFTDYCSEVLSQCRRNFQQYLNRIQFTRSPKLDAQHLDWYDYLHCNSRQVTLNYDILIASDVAYRNQDLKPLKVTIQQFLRYGSCAHVFGPIHRSVFQNLIHELKNDDHFHVETEVLKASRQRLTTTDKPMDRMVDSDSPTINFLHISIRRRNVAKHKSTASFMDID